jgi:hypothetical protein
MVKNYTDKELTFEMQRANNFKGFPLGYFLCAVRSKNDLHDLYDDKIYLCLGLTKSQIRILSVTSCTTNSGAYGIMNFLKWDKRGVAVVKSNEWYYDLWGYGLHKGKMPALKQINEVLVYRDSNKNKAIEETGVLYKGIFGINFHTATYGKVLGFVSKIIGGWSTGCIVLNKYSDYLYYLETVKKQPRVSLVLLKEK